MSDADGLASRPCTDKSGEEPGAEWMPSGKSRTGKFLAVAAECGVPEIAARALREEIRRTGAKIRTRRMTPAGGLLRVARMAVKASQLLAGRGPGATS